MRGADPDNMLAGRLPFSEESASSLLNPFDSTIPDSDLCAGDPRELRHRPKALEKDPAERSRAASSSWLPSQHTGCPLPKAPAKGSPTPG